ncbi:hypothetical protein ES703_49538 [subsurface metagenome]
MSSQPKKGASRPKGARRRREGNQGAKDEGHEHQSKATAQPARERHDGKQPSESDHQKKPTPRSKPDAPTTPPQTAENAKKPQKHLQQQDYDRRARQPRKVVRQAGARPSGARRVVQHRRCHQGKRSDPRSAGIPRHNERPGWRAVPILFLPLPTPPYQPEGSRGQAETGGNRSNNRTECEIRKGKEKREW